jgi:hypothetical protein
MGRPRIHENPAARQKAYMQRRKELAKRHAASPEAFVDGRIDTTDGRSLRTRLIDASNGNIDALADISPIRALIEQGCDLEADVLPVVARNVPDLTHPLKSWGAQWLVQDILAARDLRLERGRKLTRALAQEMPSETIVAAVPRSLIQRVEEFGADVKRLGVALEDTPVVEFEEPDRTPLPATVEEILGLPVEAPVAGLHPSAELDGAPQGEAPPPARRVSAFDWDEFVAGHRAGLIEWNTARLSPGPAPPKIRAPARSSAATI